MKRIRQMMKDLESRNIMVKKGEINPGDKALVIARDRKLEERAFAMNWGYHLSNGKLVFNTRSETAKEKPMFADGISTRRCLIPADFYYEWEKRDKEKQKYRLFPEGMEGFYLAGIYRLEGREPVFSILTRSPKEEIAFIHDRMPVIIPEEVSSDWMNPKYDAEEIIKSLHLPMNFEAC